VFGKSDSIKKMMGPQGSTIERHVGARADMTLEAFPYRWARNLRPHGPDLHAAELSVGQEEGS
jgi:hypothetical protein